MIRSLYLLPHINNVSTVASADDGPTELDAIDRFTQLDPHDGSGFYTARYWIHTHPRYKAYMFGWAC